MEVEDIRKALEVLDWLTDMEAKDQKVTEAIRVVRYRLEDWEEMVDVG